ncbi:tetratricopeptide repeat protein [Kordiimonas marina]|uniref:tetratricopeptide repeat protein n=1 Tax=Kordiimonas marina TaxID=2872312 RepID=UPI001FF1E456|nr:tetratricopeptide repeat protein [Kordiimonas marina]MCJ9429775.1 hypothetical protein [Kordiimonas marina]
MRTLTILAVTVWAAVSLPAAVYAVPGDAVKVSVPAKPVEKVPSAASVTAGRAGSASKTATATATGDADDPVEAALDLIRTGSVDAGVEELRKLGQQGHAEAFFHLGEIHRLGVGRPASIPVAIMYYRLAAQLGHKRAALNLANLLFFEAGHTQANVDEAMALWQKYALQGDSEALYLLGMAYWNGEGDRLPDPIRGYGLVWEAAVKGYADAVKTRDMMQGQLSEEAQRRGRLYGGNLDTEGFSDTPIDLYLVMGRKEDQPQKAVHKTDVASASIPGASDITADAPGVSDASPSAPAPAQKQAETPAQRLAGHEVVADAALPSKAPEAGKGDDPAPQTAKAAPADAPENTSEKAPAQLAQAAPGGDKEAPKNDGQAGEDDQPVDWSSVWHLEVGVPMKQEEVIKLQKVITVAHGSIVQGLKSEVTESVTSPGLFLLVFGPVDGLSGAVRRCVSLKRAGYDCFARAPG